MTTESDPQMHLVQAQQFYVWNILYSITLGLTFGKELKLYQLSHHR